MNAQQIKRASELTVNAVIEELNGRNGFDFWWEDIRKIDKDDILKCLEKCVAIVLEEQSK